MKWNYKGFVLKLRPSRDVNKQHYFVVSHKNKDLSQFIRYDIEDAKKLFIQYVDSYLREELHKLIDKREEISAEIDRIGR